MDPQNPVISFTLRLNPTEKLEQDAIEAQRKVNEKLKKTSVDDADAKTGTEKKKKRKTAEERESSDEDKAKRLKLAEAREERLLRAQELRERRAALKAAGQQERAAAAGGGTAESPNLARSLGQLSGLLGLTSRRGGILGEIHQILRGASRGVSIGQSLQRGGGIFGAATGTRTRTGDGQTPPPSDRPATSGAGEDPDEHNARRIAQALSKGTPEAKAAALASKGKEAEEDERPIRRGDRPDSPTEAITRRASEVAEQLRFTLDETGKTLAEELKNRSVGSLSRLLGPLGAEDAQRPERPATPTLERSEETLEVGDLKQQSYIFTKGVQADIASIVKSMGQAFRVEVPEENVERPLARAPSLSAMPGTNLSSESPSGLFARLTGGRSGDSQHVAAEAQSATKLFSETGSVGKSATGLFQRLLQRLTGASPSTGAATQGTAGNGIGNIVSRLFGQPSQAGGGGSGGMIQSLLSMGWPSTAGKVGGGIVGGILGESAGGAGGAGIGALAGASGPIGLAITAVVASVKNLVSGLSLAAQGVSQFGKSFTSGDASQAAHGIVTYIQGFGKIIGGPLLGGLLSEIIGVGHTFIDALDGIVSSLGKYSAATSLETAKYGAMQTMFQFKMAQVFEPAMTAWVKLKEAILELMNSPIFSAILSGLANMIGSIIDDLTTFVKAITWAANASMNAFKDLVAAIAWAVDRIMNPTHLIGGGPSFADLRKGADAAFGGSDESLRDRAKKTMANFLSLGGRAGPGEAAARDGTPNRKMPAYLAGLVTDAMGAIRNPGVFQRDKLNSIYDQGDREKYRIEQYRRAHNRLDYVEGQLARPDLSDEQMTDLRNERVRLKGEIKALTANRASSALQVGGVALGAAIARDPRTAEQRADHRRSIRAEAEWQRTHNPNFWNQDTHERLSDEEIARNRAGRAPARLTDPNALAIDKTRATPGAAEPPKVELPKPNWFEIRQQVNIDLAMKLAHEKAVDDAIYQVRDNLYRGIAEARNETYLYASMLESTNATKGS